MCPVTCLTALPLAFDILFQHAYPYLLILCHATSVIIDRFQAHLFPRVNGH